MFLNNEGTKNKIMDLGALPLPFSNSFIPVSFFCQDNPGRRCIFPETLKIRPKTFFVPNKILID
jgi:hypothetical protein